MEGGYYLHSPFAILYNTSISQRGDFICVWDPVFASSALFFVAVTQKISLGCLALTARRLMFLDAMGL